MLSPVSIGTRTNQSIFDSTHSTENAVQNFYWLNVFTAVFPARQATVIHQDLQMGNWTLNSERTFARQHNTKIQLNLWLDIWILTKQPSHMNGGNSFSSILDFFLSTPTYISSTHVIWLVCAVAPSMLSSSFISTHYFMGCHCFGCCKWSGFEATFLQPARCWDGDSCFWTIKNC